MAEGLSRTKTMQEKKVLILADSKAAIAAVKKAGKTGMARSKDLQRTVNMIAEVKKGGGEVKLGWVRRGGVIRRVMGVEEKSSDKLLSTAWSKGY